MLLSFFCAQFSNNLLFTPQIMSQINCMASKTYLKMLILYLLLWDKHRCKCKNVFYANCQMFICICTLLTLIRILLPDAKILYENSMFEIVSRANSNEENKTKKTFVLVILVRKTEWKLFVYKKYVEHKEINAITILQVVHIECVNKTKYLCHSLV